MKMESITLAPLIGHRGVAAQAPENTMASFQKAASLGLRWVELDVYLTRDNSLAVIHDRDLARTTTSAGDVTTLDANGLKRLDAGSKFSPTFKDEPVPTLAQVMAFCVGRGLNINIELKENLGLEKATAETLKALLPQDSSSILISSFDPAMLEAAQQRLPNIARGILFEKLPRDWLKLAKRYQCYSVHCDQKPLKAHQVKEISQLGYQVAVYTVNNPERAQELWYWGVQALFTDLPNAMEPLIRTTAIKS
jgi:glycerophosphoryl diester phosphodiesterase